MTALTAFSVPADAPLDTPEQLEEQLRFIGATRYHSLHPFHGLLHGGKLSKGQVQAWALNRYYYQSTIPIKDAVVISRFRDRDTRIEWRHRISDHDGDIGTEGGIERWIKLTEGLGLDTAYVASPSRPMCISCAKSPRSRPSPPRSPSCSRRTFTRSASRAC